MNRALIALAGLAIASASQADLLWNYGMTTGTYGGSWANSTGGQNFADIAVFGTGVTVNQYIYFTDFDPTNFGTLHVKVLADNAGVPGSLITSQDVSVASWGLDGTYSGHNVNHVVLNLSPINLVAGTYWFGASGNGFEAAQVSLNPGPGNNQMAQFSGATYQNMATIGDQAYQLMGTPVPEPASMLAFAGLVGIAVRRRRPRQH